MGHELALQTHAVPAALQLGVVPLHETAQQTPPDPLALASQLLLVHWASAPTTHAMPLVFLSRQVPTSHQRPAPHAASFGHGPHVVAVLQYPLPQPLPTCAQAPAALHAPTGVMFPPVQLALPHDVLAVGS